jgi:hypothetical protein
MNMNTLFIKLVMKNSIELTSIVFILKHLGAEGKDVGSKGGLHALCPCFLIDGNLTQDMSDLPRQQTKTKPRHGWF